MTRRRGFPQAAEDRNIDDRGQDTRASDPERHGAPAVLGFGIDSGCGGATTKP